jgi:hypothetical protein
LELEQDLWAKDKRLGTLNLVVMSRLLSKSFVFDHSSLRDHIVSLRVMRLDTVYPLLNTKDPVTLFDWGLIGDTLSRSKSNVPLCL